MDINPPLQGQRDATQSAVTTVVRNALIGFAASVQLLIPIIGAATTTSAVVESEPCCHHASASSTRTINVPPPVAVTSSDGDWGSIADATADYAGGIAARLHTADGTRVPGDVFVLMATAGSDAAAKLYDDTPFTHDYGTAADAHESNVDAVELVETITGEHLDLLELTTAPGGGPSGGLAYTIAYLNIVSDGAFSGDLRVAATGELGPDGYVQPINAINEKAAAAHLAAAVVLFSPSTPNTTHIDAYGGRRVGELFRARHTGSTLAEERRLDSYHAWGTDQPDGMDIVGVRHIADVAAYLCGTGSTYACQVTDHYNDTIIGAPTPSNGPDETSHTPTPAGLH